MRAMAITLGLLALPIMTSGHHSLAEYDRSALQELEGEVLRVMWRNPHIRFTLRRENEDGEQETWDLHGFDLNSLDRRNVPHDLVRVGVPSDRDLLDEAIELPMTVHVDPAALAPFEWEIRPTAARVRRLEAEPVAETIEAEVQLG